MTLPRQKAVLTVREASKRLGPLKGLGLLVKLCSCIVELRMCS
jgi:hypothetical protein